jgi:hypothetical protein
MSYIQIGVASPYTLRVQNSVSYSPTAPTTAVSGYVKSTSTPNSADFYSATTGTLTTTNAASTGSSDTYLITPNIITGATQNCSMATITTMTNGDVVVAYSFVGTPFTTKFNVYSNTGTFKGTYTVGSSTASDSPMVRIAGLTNGKLVVVYYSASSTLTWVVYSSAYVALATGTITNANGPYYGSYGFSVCAVTEGRWAVIFTNASSYAQINFYSDTAYLSAVTVNSGYSTYYSSIACSNNGVIYASTWNSSASYPYIYTYAEYASNSWTNIQAYANTSYSSYTYNNPPCAVSPLGSFAYWTWNGSNQILNIVEASGSTSYTAQPSVSSSNSQSASNCATAISSRGTFVSLVNDLGTTRIYESYVGPNPSANISSTSLTLPYAMYTSNYGGLPSLAAGPDGQMYFVYIGSNRLPVFGCFNLYATSYSTSVTSGVTVSTGALAPSQSNGYIFKGVATTAATAGGTGIVQTNGPAQLNSSYSASTAYQAFDSTGTVVPGTKGTIVGRNVNMTGGA